MSEQKQIQKTFFRGTGLEFEFGSIKETLKCLGVCWYQNETITKWSSLGEGDRECMRHLHTQHPSEGLPLPVGLEEQARWLSHLTIYNLSY